ncbi:MAG: cobalamin-dependent protein [Candidatus Helarchaeota archaeon]
MKILLVRPPRAIWPFLYEEDMVMPPQNLVTIAAPVDEAGFKVKILDSQAHEWGWATTRKKIEEFYPDIVGVGEMTCFAHEALKALKHAKEINPDVINIAGGRHFDSLASEIFHDHPYVDFIVRGEGDYTFRELCQFCSDANPDFRKVKGICFRENGHVHYTHPRPLADLNELPLPAYHLLEMELYSRGNMWINGVAPEATRGCYGKCKFCTEWSHIGKREIYDGKEVCTPFWRFKEPEKFVDELEILYKKYNRRFFWFSDINFDVNSKFVSDFADELLARDFGEIAMLIMMRAETVLRDIKKGVFDKMVQAGLSSVFMGMEVGSQKHLEYLGKGTQKLDVGGIANKILKERYPDLMRHNTYILGHRKDTRESIIETLNYAKKNDPDNAFFSIFTPFPGTKLFEENKQWIETFEWWKYDFTNSVMPTETLSTVQVEEMRNYCVKMFYGRIWRGVKQVTHKNLEVRKLFLFTSRVGATTMKLEYPDWYDD